MQPDDEMLSNLAQMNPTYKVALKVFEEKIRPVVCGGYGRWADIEAKLIKMGYFYHPASTRHHLSIPGGLLIHSVGVALMMYRMSRCTSARDLYPPWKIFIAGLLHDVGKCGLMMDNGIFYPRYVLVDQCPFIFKYSDFAPLEMNLRDLSYGYVSEWGLPLDVRQAVLCHDGAYLEANRPYDHKLSPLTLLATISDTYVGQIEEGKDSSKVFDSSSYIDLGDNL